MPAAFISYSRKNLTLAESLNAALTAQGMEVWIDLEDIPPAADWVDQIHAALDASDAVILLLSPEWLASDVCQTEAGWAFAAGKKVVPIVVADIESRTVDPQTAALNWVASVCGLADRDLTSQEWSRFAPDGFAVPQIWG